MADSFFALLSRGTRLRPASSSSSSASRAPQARARSEEAEEQKQQGSSHGGRVHVQGSDVPAPASTFAELAACGVPEYLVDNLTAPLAEGGLGYTEPTPIQSQAIPIMLKRREILAIAPTGSGKTAAFLVPLLTLLESPQRKGFRALVLSPTKELADQLYRVACKLARGRKWKVFELTKANANANTFGPQSSKRKDVLISTPLRLVHALRRGVLDLSGIEYLVMDEADRLLQMGFAEQVDEVMAATPASRMLFMFSATIYQGVEMKANSVLRDAVRVRVGVKNAAAATVEQTLTFVGSEHGKLIAMRQLVHKGGLDPPVLVFVQSKERATQLFEELVYEGIRVDVMHADRTAQQRADVVRKFRTGEIWVLICTDLMARGIDFKGVHCVINYDFPQSTVSYIHRIGRTGRAGRRGKAITFFTEHDVELLRGIADVMKLSGCDVPDWMLHLKKPSIRRKKEVQAMAPARKRVSTDVHVTPAAKRKWGIEDDADVLVDERKAKRKKTRRKKKKK